MSKKLVGEAFAAMVHNQMVIGVGTGTTADCAIEALALRIQKESLRVFFVPSSWASAVLLQKAGLIVLDPNYQGRIDLAFDGADEVDSAGNCIKGKGGALLSEKINVVKAEQFILLADDSKLVAKLGAKMPLPIEIIREAAGYVENELKKLGATSVVVRTGSGKHGPVITERGNMLLDAIFPEYSAELGQNIKQIVGVVEHGLFWGLAAQVLIGGAGGVRVITVTP